MAYTCFVSQVCYILLRIPAITTQKEQNFSVRGTLAFKEEHLLLLTLSMHAQEGNSTQLVCLSVSLCTADLEGRSITTVETSTNVKKMMILSPFNVPSFF